MYGWAATTWPTGHEFWPNQLSEVGSLLYCLLQIIAAKPWLIWHQSGASQPPSGPTWSGFGPTWPSRSVNTHGDTYFDNFPFYVP
jgi:hypothetical protein